MRTLLLTVCALVALETAAHAADSSIRGVKIVVPDARGKSAWGADALTKELRRTLVEAVGPLMPSRALAAMQKKLKQRGKARYEDASLTDAGKAIHAEYVLSVEVTKAGWRYTAHARLLDTASGEARMDFRSEFFKPRSDAKDRGRRIGQKAIEKLELLRGGEGDGDDGAVVRKGTEPEGDEDEDAPAPRKRGPLLSATTHPAGGAAEAAGGGPSGTGGEASMPGLNGTSDATATAVIQPQAPAAEDVVDIFRLELTGGSGVIHTYDLATPAVGASKLSYSLQPVIRAAGSAEVVVPNVPLGAFLRVGYRPAHFSVSINNHGSTVISQPNGIFFDLAGLIEAPIRLSGEGRTAIRLVPGIGGKLQLLYVNQNPGNVILSNEAVSPIASIGIRAPLGEVFELDASADGGPILFYRETPQTTGNYAGGGFTIGASVGARIWFSSALGLVLDGRYDLDRVSFNGRPTRLAVNNESLANAANLTKDLQVGLGLALRL